MICLTTIPAKHRTPHCQRGKRCSDFEALCMCTDKVMECLLREFTHFSCVLTHPVNNTLGSDLHCCVHIHTHSQCASQPLDHILTCTCTVLYVVIVVYSVIFDSIHCKYQTVHVVYTLETRSKVWALLHHHHVASCQYIHFQ